jgi:flagellar biosynthesis protein FlhG
MTRIITLIGGTEGTGESGIAADLAVRLAAGEQRVCLLALSGGEDPAGGLPNWSDITTLADSLSGHTEPSLLQLARGCDLVIGARDPHWLRTLDQAQLMDLGDRLQQPFGHDYLLIDAGAGSHQNRLAFALASPEVLLVITPASESLTAAYSLLKLFYAEQYDGSVGVLVTHCENSAQGQHTYEKLRGLAGFYLEMPLKLAGILAGDDEQEGMAALIAELQQAQDDVPVLDAAAFRRRYLEAAGALPESDDEPAITPTFTTASTPDSDLQEQLALLSGQVDDLIAEVERLRSDKSRPEPLPDKPPVQPPRPAAERCDTACIAAMASASETVTAGGETFTLYHLRQGGGRQVRFACQSIDDDLEEPEPRSSLS